jgi:hypothetical protein
MREVGGGQTQMLDRKLLKQAYTILESSVPVVYMDENLFLYVVLTLI